MTAKSKKVGTGKPGPGRPPGSQNKLTRDIKAAILGAFEKAGGEEYLAKVAKENPQVFCALLGKVLPMQVVGDPDNPVAATVTVKFV
jgi:hypothetical protein